MVSGLGMHTRAVVVDGEPFGAVRAAWEWMHSL